MDDVSAASLHSPAPGWPRWLRRLATPRAARAVSWLFGGAYWVLLPIACLVLLGMGLDTLARHVNNTPSGVRGSFEVTSHRCEDSICVTGGVFTSDDQLLRETDLIGDYRWHIGEIHAAVYQPSAIDVIPLPSKWDPTPTAAGLAGVAMVLGGWSWILAAGRRERRRARIPSPAE